MVGRLQLIPIGYKTLLDRISDLAWLMDLEGRIYLTNTTWQNQFWRSTEARIPSFWEFIRPQDEKEIRASLTNISAPKWQSQLEMKTLRGSYQLFNIELEKVSIECDRASAALRDRQLYLGTATTATQPTKLTHNSLNNGFFNRTISREWTQTAAWQWNLLTQQLSWTPEYSALLGEGIEANCCSFSQWLERIYPEDRLKIVDSKNAAIEQHLDEYRWEYRVWYRGDIRWLNSWGKIYYDAAGKPEVISGLAYDVTDYKQQEIALRDRITFAERILEGNQDCIKLLDLKGRLLYMNDGGQKLMEIDDFEGTVKNAPWLNFWQNCDRASASEAFNKACNGQIGKFEGYCATAKGTPKWWGVVVTPILDLDGRVKEILSVSRDITDIKLIEQQLLERNRELEQFSYVVSHDLKAPLRGISNLAQWIIEDEPQISSETKERLNLICQRNQRMAALIDGLLQYSRVGKQKLVTESVNMADLLIEVIDSLAPPENFKVTPVSELPTIETKKLLLSQILSNLIGNAIKHHHQDKGQIEISAIERDTHYEFAIADDGPGIPEAERESIFKMFYTSKKKSSTTNTGIGLALIEKIVAGEGGKFWLDSQTSKGSKFCFTWQKKNQ